MLSDLIANSKLKQLKAYFDEYHKIVIVAHVSPDGDAIGSSVALFQYLRDLGKDVRIVVPNDFPDFLKWMDGARDILNFENHASQVKALVDEAQLICCLDFNAAKRMECLAPLILDAKATKVLVDHHPYPEEFCDLMFSYPQLSSTSELIFRLIWALGDYDKINRHCASAIYSGMMTDTGAFTYNSNNPEIYFIISQLLLKDINKDQIYANVYNNYSVNRVRLMGYALSQKMKIYEEYNTAVIVLTKAEMDSFSAIKGDTEGFVNLPLTIKGLVFSIFVKEDTDYVKISLRSRGDFPANQFSTNYFNGGGHLNAAGGEFHGTVDEVVRIIETHLPEYKDLLNPSNKN